MSAACANSNITAPRNLPFSWCGWSYTDTRGRLTVVVMDGFTFADRVIEWKPKRPMGDDGWFQELCLLFRTSTGGRNMDWVTLTFSKQKGYIVHYDGEWLELHSWLKGLCGNGVLFGLDEWVNGRPEQSVAQTDAQYWYGHDEADDV